MATVYGSTVNKVWRAFLTYSQSNTSNTVTTVTVSSGINIPTSGYTSHRSYRDSISATGKSAITGTRADQKYTGVTTVAVASGSWTFTRTHSPQTITLTGYLAAPSSGTVSYSSTATATITIPARPSYTVTYNNNGGSGAPSAQTKWYDETLTLSSTKPTKNGYTFLGWNTSASATSASYASGGSYTGNANITLYAIWRKTITISYNANTGTGAPAAQTGYMYNSATGVSITLSSTKPTKTGYNFRIWGTTTSGGTEYSPGTARSFSSSTTLYALWTLITYTLSYNLAGGTVATANPTSYNVTTDTFTLYKPTRPYYRFTGWTGSNGTTPNLSVSIAQGSTGNKSYTANWQRTYIAPTLVIESCKRDNSEHTGDDSGVVPHITFNWVAGTDEETVGDITPVIPTGYRITFVNQNPEALNRTDTYTHMYTEEEVDSETQDKSESVYCNNIYNNNGLNTESSYDVIVELILENYDDIVAQDYISPAYFIIDINENGTAIGFGTAVENTDNGLFSQLDIIAKQDISFILDDDAGPGSESEIDYNIIQALRALKWIGGN